MLTFIKTCYKDPAIRQRIGYTLAMLVILRVFAHIIIPGVDPRVVRQITDNPMFAQLNLVSGSNLTSFSLTTLGLSPYISASIVVQVLQLVIPRLKEWAKMGQVGQHKLTLLTRALTFVFAITQTMTLFGTLNMVNHVEGLAQLKTLDYFTIIVTIIAGSMFVGFIADKITERGIGNGTSVIITLGIVTNLPKLLNDLYTDLFLNSREPQWIPAIFLAIILISIIAVSTIYQEADYRLPVQHTNNTRKSSAYLPIKLNPAGVMPVVFAGMAISIPGFLPTNPTTEVIRTYLSLANPVGILIYIMLIVGFSTMYALVQINPEKTADSLSKANAYILGVRPGHDTEVYLRRVITGLSLGGSVFLVVIASTPLILQHMIQTTAQLSLFGTSVLIMIATAIETINQLKSLTLQNNYEPIYKHK